MNAFTISFVNSIKRHFRDVTPFIMQVMAPIIMIMILGSALKGNFSTGSFLSPLKVTVVNEDNGASSKQLMNFLNSKNLDKLIKISTTTDLNTAKQLLKQEKIDGVIEIKSDYSQKYLQGKLDEIQAHITNNDKTSFQIISSILNGWKNNSAAIQIGLRNGESIDTVMMRLQNGDKLIVDKPLSKSGKLPRAMDYYAVTMVTMTLIFTGYLAMGKLQFDFLSEMKMRLHCTPVHIGVIVTGELLGTTLMGFLQSVSIVLFTHFVYGANWGNRWGIVLGTLFLLTVFGQLLASVLTLGMKNADAPQGIVGTLAMGFAFLSGGFYTSPIGGTVGKFLVTYGTPISLAQTSIFGSIYGGSSEVIYMCMGILAALSILLLGLTITFAKRRVL